MKHFTMKFESISHMGTPDMFEAKVKITSHDLNISRTLREDDDVLGRKIKFVALTTTEESNNAFVGVILGEMSKNNNFVCYEGQTIEVFEKSYSVVS